MSTIAAEQSLRDAVRQMLQKNSLVMGILLLIVASITVLDLVPAAWGVPVSLLLVWLISWAMGSTWSDLGIRRPQHWGKTIAVGLGVGIVSQLFAWFMLIPLFQAMGMEPLEYSSFAGIKGNIGILFLYLTISWTAAGFGEEIIFRGFLMGHLGRILGANKAGWILSLLIVSVMFGLSHAYQGQMGIVLTTYSAMLFGCLYIASGFNLWYSIISHGVADTFIFLLFFTGIAERYL